MKKAVIFDLDGTLINTSEGIRNSVKFAELKMGLTPLSDEQEYLKFIGPPPHETYQKLYGITAEQSLKATDFHREYGGEKGIYESELYENITEFLSQLKQKRFLMGVATYKRHDLAISIIEHFKLTQYFNSVCGLDNKNNLKKSEIIQKCVNELNVKNNDCVYIGDSEYDAIAAQNLGIDFIGLTYGFGFKNKQDVDKFNNIGVASDVRGLSDFLV